MVDLVKTAKVGVIEGIIVVTSIFGVSTYVAPLAPEWIATIPIEFSISVLVTVSLALMITGYAKKTFLKKFL